MGTHTNCRWVRAICDRCTIPNLVIQSRLGSRDRFACITVQPSDEAELLLL